MEVSGANNSHLLRLTSGVALHLAKGMETAHEESAMTEKYLFP